jgi:hypothetical protein
LTPIPIISDYKGVGIHDNQDEARISLVNREIDLVIDLRDLSALVDWAADARHSPESRMPSGQKALAIIAEAGDGRQRKPFDPEFVEAVIAGLDSQVWRCERTFGTLADHGAVPREVPLERD